MHVECIIHGCNLLLCIQREKHIKEVQELQQAVSVIIQGCICLEDKLAIFMKDYAIILEDTVVQ